LYDAKKEIMSNKEKLKFQFYFPIPSNKDDMKQRPKWNSESKVGIVMVNDSNSQYRSFIAKAEWCQKQDSIKWKDKNDVIKDDGGLFFFCNPKKIVDVCIVYKKIKDDLYVSPPLATILWNDWKWYMPFGWKEKELDVPFLADKTQSHIIDFFKGMSTGV